MLPGGDTAAVRVQLKAALLHKKSLFGRRIAPRLLCGPNFSVTVSARARAARLTGCEEPSPRGVTSFPNGGAPLTKHRQRGAISYFS